ncbi:hypothetical protein MBAV_003453 [Candidatus Magnetobacterium bavaricum]|uniref:Uncharacterized protein n=1 Tax=Candidatus Magnetobacterium bavaricum TaxID=29290 RepID=A0A0F3GUK5_9BACT|nr:hypothetical protein MBAV_003453 [Candidatus Magnetobacterium bavaricum]
MPIFLTLLISLSPLEPYFISSIPSIPSSLPSSLPSNLPSSLPSSLPLRSPLVKT